MMFYRLCAHPVRVWDTWHCPDVALDRSGEPLPSLEKGKGINHNSMCHNNPRTASA